MNAVKEYLLKSFLLVGGCFTIVMIIEILLIRMLSFQRFGSFYPVFYMVSIFIWLFLACYLNFKLANKEVDRKTLRRKNQAMVNLPLFVLLYYVSDSQSFFEHTGAFGYVVGWNILFIPINLLYTFLILRIFKGKKPKNLVDIIDQGF